MNDDIVIISESIGLEELKVLAQKCFGDMVKGVVDLERGIIALGGELHVDEEAVLLSQGSKQENLWGINLYVDLVFPDMLEFDSMINIRPRQNNRSRAVEDQKIREQILILVNKLVKF